MATDRYRMLPRRPKRPSPPEHRLKERLKEWRKELETGHHGMDPDICRQIVRQLEEEIALRGVY